MFKNALSLLCCLPFFFFACDDDPEKTGCGNGLLDLGEVCDGAAMPQTTCAELGYYEQTGALGCRADCTLDLSVCAGSCGDGIIQVPHGEDCEGENLAGDTCTTLGLGGGVLTCSPTCRFDVSACEVAAVCGDSEIQSPFEACDGADLDGQSCETLGYHGGQLACGGDCRFELSSCMTHGLCGDALIQDMYGEECDGANLDGNTCAGLGYHGGQLACGGDCRFDVTACEAVGRCGDGMIQATYGEECEGSDLGGASCLLLGHHGGALACDEVCAFDISGCEYCGDGVVQTVYGEQCDGTALGGATCMATDLFFGAPACDGACALTAGTCRDTELWGTTADELAVGVVVDFQGNVYVAGATRGAMDGQILVGGADAFLSKFNRYGVRQWTRLWGSTGDESVYGVSVDSSGNIYVAGATNLSFDGQTSAGDVDAFLTKWSENGQKAWTRLWGTTGADEARAVTTDTLGNIYVTGQTGGALPGQTAAGMQDLFLVRFDALGNRALTRQWGSTQDDIGHAVFHDGVGNIYVAGAAGGSFGGQVLTGLRDAVLMKLSASTGDPAWVRFWGTTMDDLAYGVAVGPGGEVFVCGETHGTMEGNVSAGGGDLFLTRFSAAGDRAWTRQRGSTSYDHAYALVAAPAGFITVVAVVSAALDGQPFAGAVDFTALRFDLDGNHQWTRAWGTSDDDYAISIAADATGHVWIAGGTEGALNGRTNTGDTDAFLLFIP